MDIDKPNRWLNLSANVGVLDRIIFLAVEIQQNSKAQIRSATQAAVGNYVGSSFRS